MNLNVSAALFIMVCLLVGCSFGGSKSMFDKRTDDSGQTVYLDTENNWSIFKSITDSQIKEEFTGGTRNGGAPSWDAFWKKLIEGLEDGSQDNHERYVNYIISERRLRGLPELH